MKLLTLLSMLLTSVAFAQSPTPTPTPEYPKINAIEGQPLTFSFSDGRAGELVVNYGKAYSMSIPFQIGENTCTDASDFNLPQTKQFQCVIKDWALVDTMALRWTNHPNPDKVGKFIKRAYGNMEEEQSLTANSTDVQASPELLKGRLPKTQLICKDYSWLPGGQKSSPPQTLKVIRWETELMSNNGETQIAELRANGALSGLVLGKNQNGALEFASVKDISTFSVVPFAAAGIVISAVMKRSDGEVCTIVLQGAPDLPISKLQAKFEEEKKAPKNYQPYIWGSNELIIRFGDLSPSSYKFKDEELVK